MIRTFIPVWILAPIVSLLFSGTIHMISSADGPLMSRFSEYVGPILLLIFGILFVAVIVGMLLMTLILVIRRFWNGLLKEEGYLAFTLPVTVRQLILSKAIVSTLVTVGSWLITALSCLILSLGISRDMFYSINYLFSVVWDGAVHQIGAYTGVLMVLGVLLMLVLSISGTYRLYVSMSLGQLAEEHRVAGSFVAYIGLGMVLSVIANIGAMILSVVMPDYMNMITAENAGFFFSLYLLFLLIINVIQLVIFHVITEYVLTNKLNLE